MMKKNVKSPAQRQKDENEFYQIHGSWSTRFIFIVVDRNYDFIRWSIRILCKYFSAQHISRICEALILDPFSRRPRKARK